MPFLETDLSFAPLAPWPLLATLLVLAVAASVVLALVRSRGWGWRAAALAVLLVWLANPTLVREQYADIRDTGIIVVDDSPSQRLGNRAVETATATAELKKRLEAVEGLDVRVVRGRKDQAAEGTRLFSALEEALVDVPAERVAAAILVTDGQVHDTPADPGRIGFPIHVLLTGTPGAGDRRLVVEKAPRYGIVGRTIEMTVRVDDPASVGRRDVPIVIRRNGGGEERRTIPSGESTVLRLPLHRPGQTLVEIEAAKGPEEITLQNNRAAVVINGVRDRLRVLLVSGEPHVGERIWRNMLKSDPAVDLIHFTILRPPENIDATPVHELALIPFPTRELFQEKLDDFDLIIFDRYRQRGILPQLYIHNIVDYVQAGGALLVAAGATFAGPFSLYRTPIGAILPSVPTGRVGEEEFRPRLTALGRRHAITAPLARTEAQGWGRWFRQVDSEVRSGQVLMEGRNGMPLVVVDRVGEGRVAQIMSDHVWLWARGYDGGGPHAELLRRVAHWLMKEPDLEENALHARAEENELVIERRTLEPANRPVTITSPSGKKMAVSLRLGDDGAEHARIKVNEAGLYRLTDGELETVAGVGSLNALEFADVTATDAKLASVAAATGGAVRWLAKDGVPELRRVESNQRLHGSGWIGLRESAARTVVGVESRPLIPTGLMLLALLATFAFAWWYESR